MYRKLLRIEPLCYFFFRSRNTLAHDRVQPTFYLFWDLDILLGIRLWDWRLRRLWSFPGQSGCLRGARSLGNVVHSGFLTDPFAVA